MNSKVITAERALAGSLQLLLAPAAMSPFFFQRLLVSRTAMG